MTDPADVGWEELAREIGSARVSRKAAVTGSEAAVAAVSAVLFRHDPVGINFEVNTDEYDPEAETIVAELTRLERPPSVADVESIVDRTLSSWFDGYPVSEAACRAIAEEIADLLVGDAREP